jgi:hypothetical protein
MMNRMVDNLEAVFAYMDDSWVSFPDRQPHLIHLEAFFPALAANGLAITLDCASNPTSKTSCSKNR